MAATNHPEKPFFDRLVSLHGEIADRRADLSALHDEIAREETIGKDGLKVLKAAVKRHLEDSKKRLAREKLESDASDLLNRLGHLRGTPLADAAVRAEVAA